ncbi:DUF935 domain-containing protein [Chelatococcus sp. XZ-Ab1]|uniref:DUF935 domain-containing protein n=1 Tax=Chelatococcus sp. XZ-Ab1 TaxID=3034027 RepID=UPI0023E41840|nr:DUF935 domain-containing protein [Chelatococcus sp. XZ-Ab1]
MADKPGLVDWTGVPIRSRRELEREEAVPSVTGIQHRFDETVASGLTPARLASSLRDAAAGDMYDFLTLAEEMEERELHYRYVLETRKNGVTSLNVQVDPASENARDVEIADFLRNELVETPTFQQLPDMLVDGLAKGYSVVEMVWRTGNRWVPERFIWRDPRLFHFDRETRRAFRLRIQAEPDGRPLTPLKYLTHVPLLKMGLPARNGLARIAAWAFMFKSFSMRDWAQFLEVYGMPLRLGKYGPGSSKDDRAVLLAAVRRLGRDAAAIVPEGMNIEFVEPKGFSDRPFEGHARFIDEQMSKLIIGKPGDGTASSRAGEETLDKVRIDIKRSDTRDLQLTLMQQLIIPVVQLNFGPQVAYPKVHFPIPERKDLQVWSNAVTSLVDRGLEVEQSQVYDVLGLKEPAKGAKLLTAGQARAAPQVPVEKASAIGGAGARPSVDGDAPPGRGAMPSRYRLDPRVCPACGPARLQADGGEDQDEIDALVAAELDGWRPVMDPILQAVRAAAEDARDYDEFLASLDRLDGQLPVDGLARRIAVLNMIGRGRGDAGEE